MNRKTNAREGCMRKITPIKFNFFPMIKIKKRLFFIIFVVLFFDVLMFCFCFVLLFLLFFCFLFYVEYFVPTFCLVSNDFVIATIINCIIITDIPSENSTNTTKSFHKLVTMGCSICDDFCSASVFSCSCIT